MRLCSCVVALQEECAENIARLVHFPDADTSLLFFKCGFQTLVHEWFGIDQLRLDKFLMVSFDFCEVRIVVSDKYVVYNHRIIKVLVHNLNVTDT